MKQKIAQEIYQIFTSWSALQKGLSPVCNQGCQSCCTVHVTLTAIEGMAILRHIMRHHPANWFAEKITASVDPEPAIHTTNAFAKACIDQQELPHEPEAAAGSCMFLEKGRCSIYPVRPFSCRLFVSNIRCTPNSPAEVPATYLEACTAVSQLLEHLGQKEYWGKMPHLLLALLDQREFSSLQEQLDPSFCLQGRLKTLTALPLPGFLLSGEGEMEITQLLTRIFDHEVEGRKIGDILNGRQ